MTRFPRRLAALGLALSLTLAACDTATPDLATSDLESPDRTAETEDAVLSVAAALALDGGGVLEDAAAAAGAATTTAGRSATPRPGCRPTTAFGAATLTYTFTTACTRGGESGRFAAAFSRVATARFLGAGGQPQADRATATALDFDILSGTSRVTTPRGTHRLLSLTADLAVTGLDQALVTVNGTYARSTADTLRSRRGERTMRSDLALTLADVRGPRGVEENWHRAVSGTLTGTYHAVRTATNAAGETTTREIDREIDVTLPGGGSDLAEISVGGRLFHADRRTGAVREID